MVMIENDKIAVVLTLRRQLVLGSESGGVGLVVLMCKLSGLLLGMEYGCHVLLS